MSARCTSNDVLTDNVKALLSGYGGSESDGLTARQRLREKRKQEVRDLYELKLPLREASDTARVVISNSHHQQYDEPVPSPPPPAAAAKGVKTEAAKPILTAAAPSSVAPRAVVAAGQPPPFLAASAEGGGKDVPPPAHVPLMNNLLSGKYYSLEAPLMAKELERPHGLGHRDAMERRQELVAVTMRGKEGKRPAAAIAAGPHTISTAVGPDGPKPLAPPPSLLPQAAPISAEEHRTVEKAQLPKPVPKPAAPVIRCIPQDDAHDHFGRKQLAPKPRAGPEVNPITHVEQRSVGTEPLDQAPPKHVAAAIKALRPTIPAWTTHRDVQMNTDLTGRCGRKEMMTILPKMGHVDPTITVIDPQAPDRKSVV